MIDAPLVIPCVAPRNVNLNAPTSMVPAPWTNPPLPTAFPANVNVLLA